MAISILWLPLFCRCLTIRIMAIKYSDDPIRSAKASGKGYSDTSKSCEYFPTPDSKPGKADGHLGDKGTDQGPRLYSTVNPAAKPDTYTGPKGSTRPGDKSD